MENTKEELKTPEEWAELAGIMVNSYDGFLQAYDKVAGKEDKETTASEYIMSRTSIIPKYLLCTRQAFDSALPMCTCTFPKDMNYANLSMVAPNFCESHLSKSFYGFIGTLKDIQKYGELPDDYLYTKEELMERALKDFVSYENAIANNKILNNVQEQRDLSCLEGDSIIKRNRIISSAIRKGGTVEELEQKILKKLIKSLEQVISGKKEPSTISVSQVEALSSIRLKTARAKKHSEIEIEEECYKNPYYGQEHAKTDMQPYRIIDEHGMQYVVAGMRDDVVVSREVNEKVYEEAKKAKEATLSMKSVVAASIDDCTLSDIIDVDLLEKNPDKEAEQGNQTHPGNGGNR